MVYLSLLGGIQSDHNESLISTYGTKDSHYKSSHFCCSLLGVSTANHLSPPNPILYIIFTPTH